MSDLAKCLNCGAQLTGPYCASCGQKPRDSDLTLRDFVADATEELTHWEGKVPQTLKTLLTRPGILTLDFLAGRRARWLPPFRVYLICSVAYFLSDALAETITHRSQNAFEEITYFDSAGIRTLTPEGRRQIEAQTFARVFGLARVERAILNNERFNRAVDSALPKAAFVLVPLFALLTRLVWRNKQPRYVPHLYLALHVHAAWFAALTISTLLTAFTSSETVLTISGVVALVFIAWYALVSFRRLFGDSWPRTLAKGTALGTAYFIVLSVVSTASIGYALLMT